MQHIVQKHLKDGGLLLLAVVGANFMNFVFNALLGRTLSFEAFSLVALVVSFYYVSGVVTNSLSASINFAVSKVVQENESVAQGIALATIRRATLLALIATTAWLILAPALRSFFNLDSVWPIIAFAPSLVLSTVVYGVIGYEQGTLNFSRAALLILSEPVSKVAIALLMFLLGWDQYTYISVPASLLVATVVATLLLRNKPAHRLNTSASLQQTMRFPKQFFAATVLVGLCNVIFFSFDVQAVKHFFSATEAGQYAVLSLIGKMMFFFCTLGNIFILPVIARSNSDKARTNFLNGLFAITAGLACIGFISLGSFGSLTLPLLLGEKVISVLPLVPIYLIGIIALSLSQTLVSYHLALQEYAYAALVIAAAFFFMLLIFTNHHSLSQVVQSIAASCTLLFIISVAAHTASHLRRGVFHHAE